MVVFIYKNKKENEEADLHSPGDLDIKGGTYLVCIKGFANLWLALLCKIYLHHIRAVTAPRFADEMEGFVALCWQC